MNVLSRLDRRLAPTEDAANLLLAGLALVAVLVLLFGSPTLKAAVAAWMVLP